MTGDAEPGRGGGAVPAGQPHEPGAGGPGLGAAAPDGPCAETIALTPAARGYPGGLADAFNGEHAPPAGYAAQRRWGEEGGWPEGRDRPEGVHAAAAGSSVWQRSLAVWREAGIDWERGPGSWGPERATAEQAPSGAAPAGSLLSNAAPGGAAPGQGGPAPGGAAPGQGGPAPGGAAAGGAAGPRRRRRAVLAALTGVIVAAGAVVGVVVSGPPRAAAPRPGFGLARPYAPARLAGADFAAPAGSAGPVQAALAAVAAAGGSVVAVGSQPGLPGARPVILVSPDGGHTWQRAVPPPFPGRAGAAPTVVAGGGGRWLALGPAGGWISPDGQHWRAVPGLPGTAAGDRVTALTRTAGGFAAVGDSLRTQAGHLIASPSLWTSANGLAWQRSGAAALGLSSRAARSVRLRWVASHGRLTMIAGEFVTEKTARLGRRRLRVRTESPAMWLSGNGGRTWRSVTLPRGRQAVSGLWGFAASRLGFVAVRPGVTRTGRPEAVVYFSGQGSAWRPVAGLAVGTPPTLRAVTVAGSWQGAVVTGIAHGRRYAFVSVSGRRWRPPVDLGSAFGVTVTGLTVGPQHSVVAAGASAPPGAAAASGRPFLLLAGPRARPVGQAALAGAASPDAMVRALVRVGRGEVAAGSVDGAPAVWRAVPGRSWAGSAVSLPEPWRGGGGGLASAASGPAGWVAVGSTTGFGGTGPAGIPGAPGVQRAGAAGTAPGAAGLPVLMVSRDGVSWRPAPNAQSLLAAGVTLAQVVAGRAGYVVVGGEQAGGGQSPAAWYSPDLARWGRAGVAWPGSAGGPGPQRMLAVTAAGSDFVAAGYAGNSPAVWSSRTGRGWALTALPLPRGAAGAALTSVTAHGERVVATGTAAFAATADAAPGDGTAAFAAVSRNGGRSWRELMLPRPPRAADLRVSADAVTGVPGGFVAAGSVATATGQDVLIWCSPDGLAWHVTAPAARLLRGPGWHAITALAATGHGLTAAGYVATPAGQYPILWQARFR